MAHRFGPQEQQSTFKKGVAVRKSAPFQVLSGGQNDLSNGPVTKRSCTDLWCLLVLLAAWLAYIVVTVAGPGQGNPHQVVVSRWLSGAKRPLSTRLYLSYLNLCGRPKCGTSLEDFKTERLRSCTCPETLAAPTATSSSIGMTGRT